MPHRMEEHTQRPKVMWDLSRRGLRKPLSKVLKLDGEMVSWSISEAESLYYTRLIFGWFREVIKNRYANISASIIL